MTVFSTSVVLWCVIHRVLELKIKKTQEEAALHITFMKSVACNHTILGTHNYEFQDVLLHKDNSRRCSEEESQL